MKIRTKEIYNCDHCNKLYLRKKPCETHEKYCMKNPQNIPKCFGCEFLAKTESQVGNRDDFDYGKPAHFYCTTRGQVMHPMKLQSKIDRDSFHDPNIQYFLQRTESELMPKECDLFEADVHHRIQNLKNSIILF